MNLLLLCSFGTSLYSQADIKDLLLINRSQQADSSYTSAFFRSTDEDKNIERAKCHLQVYTVVCLTSQSPAKEQPLELQN